MSFWLRLSSCLLVSGLLLTGCKTGLPATHYYLLTGPSSTLSSSASSSNEVVSSSGETRPTVLIIETFLVDPPYDQDAVVYHTTPDSGEVGFYAYHRWASPLGRLVAVALAEGLRGTPGLGRVEPSTGTEAKPSIVLRGRVVQAAEIANLNGVIARFELDVQLVEVSASGEEAVTWTRRVSGEVDGQPATAVELMELMQKAFDEAVGEIRVGLEETLS